jgi:predicted TPR repeat methyltransferase
MHPIAARQEAGSDALAGRLLHEGLRLLRAGRGTEAVKLLEAASRKAPVPTVWRALADAQLETDDPAGALRSTEAALAQEPGCHITLTLRARAHGRSGDHEGALRTAADAVSLAPRDPAARAALAQALAATGSHDDAIAVLGELWQEAPEDAGRTLHLAEAFLRGRRLEPAAELCTHTLARDDVPQHLRRAAHRIGVQVALMAGDWRRAVSAAETGLAACGPDLSMLSGLGHAMIRLGDMAGARPHLRAALRLNPDDRYLAHLVAAAEADSAAPQPERATDDYVEHLFDGYAESFEASLLGLGYRVPGLVLRVLEELMPALGAGGRLGDVLDLGCGTGLVGVVLHDLLDGRLKGVDLSASMLKAAAAKRIYTELCHQGLDTALAADTTHYQLVIAADVFCYFGELGPSLSAIAPRLAPEGLCVFTVERHDGEGPWLLTDSGRYRHNGAALRATLVEAGLEPVVFREEPLRQERSDFIHGYLVVARRAGGRA